MKIADLTALATKKTGTTVNQSLIAEILGVTRQTISNRVKNDSELTVSELIKVEEYFNIQLLGNPELEAVQMPYYQDVFASCGSGNIVFSEDKISVGISKQLIKNYSSKKQYSMINASGDSMSPFINTGDKLIVEHKDEQQISDNKIYAFCFKNDFFVKRLSKNIDELIIKSDNSDYKTKVIKNEDLNSVHIIGEIVGIIREV